VLTLVTLGVWIVGLVFLWTGAIKAIAPHTFRGHLHSLGWIPDRFLTWTVVTAAAFELGLGAALLLGVTLPAVFPLTIGALGVLSTVSWLGVKTGKAVDCGCYGGFADPSIYQSIAINITLVVIIVIAWIALPFSTETAWWKVAATAAAALVGGMVTLYAQRYNDRTGRLLFDTNPLKPGRRWRHSWAGNLTRDKHGEAIIAFLGPDCPYCAEWVRVGNAIGQSPLMPRVYGVVAATAERRNQFIRDNQIRFPVANISQSIMGRLAQAVPTTVLIQDERIEQMWTGSAPPPEFVDRIKAAFFPQVMSSDATPLTIARNG
jgi:hypothetical protein